MVSECSMPTNYDSGDDLEFYHITTVKANKEHRCSECNRTIRPGEQYQKATYLYAGEWYRDKTCSDCLSVASEFYPRGGYNGGMLWEDVKEGIRDKGYDVPERCLINLSESARNKICDFIDEEVYDHE